MKLNKKTFKNIKPDDSSYNLLLQSLLGDLLKDLAEAEANVKRYESLLTDTKNNEMNLSMYGPLLNEALKIKAAVRDKIIKILSNLKDRVKTKETQNATGQNAEEYSEQQLSELADQVESINSER